MLDASTFRSVLGRLASGVSVVTTVGPGGKDHGMTVTALCSLSLDPPLVLACVAHTATLYPLLADASHFAVSILALGQEAIARRFAETRDDKFDGIEHDRGEHGCALLAGALAHLECATWARHPGGDHTIVVGQVLRAAAREAAPLVYHRGAYSGLAP